MIKLPYKFGKYVLLKKIAQGGMAEIYLAKYKGERGFAKQLAVKRILPHWSDRKEFEDMLVDEARALEHLTHQNIVQVFELGLDNDCFYISMEYIDGIDLGALSKKVRGQDKLIPEKFSCYIFCEVLKALDFAHSRAEEDGTLLNIVHRDISPQNILVSFNGEVKLTDFGIARGSHREQETTVDRLKGKYAYMSPEQASLGAVDLRSDLYSTAIVLYELLSGSKLFGGQTDCETIENVRSAKFPFGWSWGLSLTMRQILNKALMKDPGKRYQCAAEFLKDLDKYIKMKSLHTHSIELAEYLRETGIKRELVKKDVEKKRGTKILGGFKNATKYKMRRASLIRYVALIMLFLPFLTANLGKATGNIEQRKLPLPAEVPELKGGYISIETDPSGAEGVVWIGGVEKRFKTPFILTGLDVKEETKVEIRLSKSEFEMFEDKFVLRNSDSKISKKYKLKSLKDGTISIQARPWGIVSIAGVLSGREAPVHRMKLRPGVHQILVRYPPADMIARAEVIITPGARHSCLADFTRGAMLKCR